MFLSTFKKSAIKHKSSIIYYCLICMDKLTNEKFDAFKIFFSFSAVVILIRYYYIESLCDMD